MTTAEATTPETIQASTICEAFAETAATYADQPALRTSDGSIDWTWAEYASRVAKDSEGWLHSGDVGEFDDDGYLRIVDRIKELIINAAGKNMSPANIEATLKMGSDLIGQACVIGDARPYNVALITLDPATTGGKGPEDPAIQEEIAAGVERANAKLARVEQIKKFTVLESDWQPDGDELTPTMKLKRKPIAEKYAAEIEAMYAS